MGPRVFFATIILLPAVCECNGLSGDAWIGVIVGSIIAFIIILNIVLCCCCRNRVRDRFLRSVRRLSRKERNRENAKTKDKAEEQDPGQGVGSGEGTKAICEPEYEAIPDAWFNAKKGNKYEVPQRSIVETPLPKTPDDTGYETPQPARAPNEYEMPQPGQDPTSYEALHHADGSGYGARKPVADARCTALQPVGNVAARNMDQSGKGPRNMKSGWPVNVSETVGGSPGSPPMTLTGSGMTFHLTSEDPASVAAASNFLKSGMAFQMPKRGFSEDGSLPLSGNFDMNVQTPVQGAAVSSSSSLLKSSSGMTLQMSGHGFPDMMTDLQPASRLLDDQFASQSLLQKQFRNVNVQRSQQTTSHVQQTSQVRVNQQRVQLSSQTSIMDTQI